MPIEKREHIRFSIDVSASLVKSDRERQSITLKQISVGGGLTDCNENFQTGDIMHLEFTLSNGNFLPLLGTVIYKYDKKGVGIGFTEICQFEQELLASVISDRLEKEGLPLTIDPMSFPPKKDSGNKTMGENDNRKFEHEVNVDQIETVFG